MKSLALAALLLTSSLVPALALAQTGPYTQTVTTGFQVGYIAQSPGFYANSFGTGGTGSCASGGIGCVASTIVYIINAILVPVLFALAFMVFLYGVFKKYIWSHGDEGAVEEGHKLILWGIVGFVVMVSLWGLVNVVANTFGLGGVGAPTPPTSIPR